MCCCAGCTENEGTERPRFFTVDDAEYLVLSEEEQTVRLVSYFDGGQEILSYRVPSLVKFEEVFYEVTEVGDCAFLGADITFLYVEPGVKRIGNNAFAHTSVQLVTFLGAVEELGDRAFGDCARLREVTFAAVALPPTLGGNVFSLYHKVQKQYVISPSLTLKVPQEALSLYKKAFGEEFTYRTA